MASPESEDEDVKKAIAISLAEAGIHPRKDKSTTPQPDRVKQSSSTGSLEKHGPGFLGLDRKAMEEERLARIASRKRERPISPPLSSDSRKAPRLEEKTVTLESGARLKTFSTLVQDDQNGRKTQIANAASERLKTEPLQRKPVIKSEDDAKVSGGASLGLRHPHGVVKKTWAFGHERSGNDIKLEEVLEPATLRTAVLSAFQWDVDWVLSKLKIPPNGGTTKCIFVMQAKEDTLREQMLRETSDMRAFLRLCFPPMGGQIYCMHSKLMLLFHGDKLRIAIPTANLLNFDWGETGVMENSVFLIDLPRLPEGSAQQIDDLPFFGQEMLYFLQKQGIPSDVRTGVLNFDFTATRDMAFVHTVGGSSAADEAQRTGLPGLARSVRHLDLTTDDLEVDFAASSIGSLNDNFLRNVHTAARGEDLYAAVGAAATKAKTEFFQPKGQTKVGQAPSPGIREKIRIYFPTHDTVTASTAGAAGTICLSREWFEAGAFPRSCFRDYRSTRRGLLSHNKIFYARGTQIKKARDIAWAYVGSANMSESAWGKLGAPSHRQAKVYCRNWECGVLLPVAADKLQPVKTREHKKETVKKEDPPAEDSETESEEEEGGPSNTRRELVGMDVFNGLVDIPFVYPGERYGSRNPWYFKERS